MTEPATNYAIEREAQLRWEARRRAKVKLSFYFHAGVYLGVNLLLLVIDLLTGPGWWFYWALFGWGIGLVAHAIGAFALQGGAALLGRLEERELSKLREGEPAPGG